MRKAVKKSKKLDFSMLLRFALAGLFSLVGICYAVNCPNLHDACQNTGGKIAEGDEFHAPQYVYSCSFVYSGGWACEGWVYRRDICHWTTYQSQCTVCGSVCSPEKTHEANGHWQAYGNQCVHL